MNEDNYNEETVGTAETYEDNTKATHFTYGDAIEHLRNGGMISRMGWDGAYVFKQVPSKVPTEIIPKMSSLPKMVKNKMTHDGIQPDYHNQLAIVYTDGTINSWSATVDDTFAKDWQLMMCEE